MSNRVKSNTPRINIPSTREEAEEVVREITEYKLRERQLKVEMDTEITAIKENYEARLATVSDRLTPLVQEIQAWAESHPAEFCDKKSLELLHGVIGWRITPPALKTLRGFTWAAVVDRLKVLGRGEFLRVKEEVNKDSLLAVRESENLKTFGCQAVQEDEFYVEPKLTPTGDRAKAGR